MNNGNASQKGFGLLDRSVPIEAIGVIYNVLSDDIESFLFNYLKDIKKIDGVAAIRTRVIRDGSAKPELKVYAMFHMDSSDITSNLADVPKQLRRKMDGENYRVSEKLRNKKNSTLNESELFDFRNIAVINNKLK